MGTETETNTSMIRSQNKRYYGPNMQRLESKPIECTYFNISINDSTVSSGTETIQEKLGSNSPLRFVKIQHFLLYGFREFNREINKTEYHGNTIDTDNESVILGGTIEPHVGDFIVIVVGERHMMFEVTSAFPTTLLANPHYKISYKFKVSKSKDVGKLFDLIEEQVVSRCTFKIDNIGTDRTPIVDMSTEATLNTLSRIYKRMNSRYIARFYDDINNNIIFRSNDGDIIYSPLLVEYQRREKPLMYELSNLCCQELLLTHEASDVKLTYMDSVYYAISEELENPDAEMIIDIEDFDDIFVEFKKNIYNHREFSTLNQYKNVLTLSNDTIGLDVTLDSASEVVSLIKLALVNIESDDTITSLKKFRVNNTLECYMFTPVLLHVIKSTMASMQTRL